MKVIMNKAAKEKFESQEQSLPFSVTDPSEGLWSVIVKRIADMLQETMAAQLPLVGICPYGRDFWPSVGCRDFCRFVGKN